MNDLEATMWRAERHPQSSMQGGMLQILDKTPAWDDVLKIHVAAIDRFPRFRQRVLEPAIPIGNPVWIDDEQFDLLYHVRRINLPTPGSMQDLLDCVQVLAAAPIARNRAPWVATFIEGLANGRCAYFVSLHHCLMDGNASVQLVSELQRLDFRSEHQPDRAVARRRSSSSLQLAAEQAARGVSGMGALAGRALSTAVRAVREGPAANLRFIRSVGRVAAPPPPGQSDLLSTGHRATWRYGTLECGLDELKAAGRAAGGTLNDTYVSAILGGIRGYHEHVGATIGDIVVSLPVSVRKADDPAGGNRFAGAFISGPTSVADPKERIQKINAIVSSARAEPALDFFSLFLPILNRAPGTVLSALFTGMQNRANLTTSSVPGLPDGIRVLGASVEATYYFPPLPGSSIMTVLLSQNGRCFISVNCDGEIFQEPLTLFAMMQTSLDETLALANRL